jgi:hypothetical protein
METKPTDSRAVIGWNGNFEHASHPSGLAILEHGHVIPVSLDEVAREGLGHIVTSETRAIPSQREAPEEEQILEESEDKSAKPPQSYATDSSFYLG